MTLTVSDFSLDVAKKSNWILFNLSKPVISITLFADGPIETRRGNWAAVSVLGTEITHKQFVSLILKDNELFRPKEEKNKTSSFFCSGIHISTGTGYSQIEL